MKVRVSSIPPEGLEVKGTISLERLNQRMNEGRNNDITFTSIPQVEMLVLRTVTGAETQGKVHSRYTQPCARCLDGIDKELEVELKFVLEQRNSTHPQSGRQKEDFASPTEKFEDDIGIIYFEGDIFDFEETVQEALILALALYWSPPLDEHGACIRCGRKSDVPKGEKSLDNSLGQLMKKAGVKLH